MEAERIENYLQLSSSTTQPLNHSTRLLGQPGSALTRSKLGHTLVARQLMDSGLDKDNMQSAEPYKTEACLR